MGVEVAGADITPGQAKVIEGDVASLPEMDSKTKLNLEQGPEEPIGSVDSSHGENGVTKETDHVAPANFPKDAADEWPAPKQIHSFYFVRFRSYEDPKLKGKIELADKEIQRKSQARFQITEALKAKRSERSNVISLLRPLSKEDKQYRTVINEKRKEIEPLTTALGKLRSANTTAREKGIGLCSSVEELNDLIHSLHYLIQHESNTLVEEKQLLKEIKQLEGTREKVIANASMKAKIQDSLGQKESIQDQVKLIGGDMDGVRKDQQAVRSKIKHLEEELRVIEDEIHTLEVELAAVSEKRGKAYETLTELRNARDEVNACFYQNRSLLNSAKDLAAKKDVAALEELSHNEVEKFMSQWSSSKAFRDDYEKRILPSLDSRQLSRDGRMRNPDEKPIILASAAAAAAAAKEPEITPLKMTVKRAKEDSVPPQRQDAVSTHKVEDEIIKSTEVEPRGKSGDPEGVDNSQEIGKSLKELSKATEIDAAKLKEMKREEEITKAKLAMERKKKLAEKAAAKAAARAQKEAEKKMKEREKKAKKKSGAPESATPAEETETDGKNSEPEEAAEVKSDTLVPANSKEQKEKVRRRNLRKVSDPLPKVLLKRKKSHSYWTWAVPAAVMLAMVLVIVGYYYLGRN